MKRLTLFFLLCSLNFSYAQRVEYDNGKMILDDGTVKTGFVETFMGDEFVRFKKAEKDEAEKVLSERIATIIYLNDDNKTTEIEYDRIKVYLGWKQRRISKVGWYRVVERGIATLYVQGTVLQGTLGNPNSKAGFQDYFVIRKGELAAKMIANISGANNNQTFRAKARLYFEDYPELAAKIKSKEYTWKDLVPVIRAYNTWAAKKK